LAEKFNNYFASVFIVEDTPSLSSANNLLSDVSTTKLLEIIVNETIMRKKLDKPRSDKAGGADNQSPRILLELKEEICHPITVIVQVSIYSGGSA